MDTRSASAMQQGLEEDLYHRVSEYESIGAFSPAEKVAAEMAERFVFDHVALKDDEIFWEKAKANFTDQQILELVTLIGFCLGMGRVLTVLNIANDCPLNLTVDPDEDPTYYAHG
jgi:alkylhydroperoxidase family enzyme